MAGLRAYLASSFEETVMKSAPELPVEHRNRIKPAFESVFDDFMKGRTNSAARRLRSLLFLIRPHVQDEGQKSLLNELLDVLRQAAGRQGRDLDQDCFDAVPYSENIHLPEVDGELRERFGIVHDTPFLLPEDRRRALLQALQDAVKEGEPPECPITRETLFEGETWKITPDVVGIFEEEPQHPGRFHAFFYNGHALREWFSSSGCRNPLTRETIDEANWCQLSRPEEGAKDKDGILKTKDLEDQESRPLMDDDDDDDGDDEEDDDSISLGVRMPPRLPSDLGGSLQNSEAFDSGPLSAAGGGGRMRVQEQGGNKPKYAMKRKGDERSSVGATSSS
uniref:Uncharacterized protein n=1 Tax=Chromera velia CCMP2878 TaxID=1169474 RepID=A0A0G4FP50_9ALVE|eukprot:Cvel_3568.t1-p1 / transcript=Cvel_3568.t1 / gene=Cvel_3568 / organism=Chromera_velia_CCMP2878 / gene_product=hypothetical protein / transcript_product=hypothetical protein / location=Cvel_scaffold146:29473-32718(+) / protein_length=335 / sequence_SO=supercontig / SO=protein_coding / is_pseudo=false